MLRLLFLCLIVTLRGAAASSEESEGSADVGDGDDEDLITPSSGVFNPLTRPLLEM